MRSTNGQPQGVWNEFLQIVEALGGSWTRALPYSIDQSLQRLPKSLGANSVEPGVCEVWEKAIGGYILAVPPARVFLLGIGWQHELITFSNTLKTVWMSPDRAIVLDPNDDTFWFCDEYSTPSDEFDANARIYRSLSPLGSLAQLLIDGSYSQSDTTPMSSTDDSASSAATTLPVLSDRFAEFFLTDQVVGYRSLLSETSADGRVHTRRVARNVVGNAAYDDVF